MAEKKYITNSDVPLNSTVSDIRRTLARLGIREMDIDIRWEVNNGACLVSFTYNGQKYQRRSIKQPNASKNIGVRVITQEDIPRLISMYRARHNGKKKQGGE